MYFVLLPPGHTGTLASLGASRRELTSRRAPRPRAHQNSKDQQLGPNISNLRPPTPRWADSPGFDGVSCCLRPPAPRLADSQGGDDVAKLALLLRPAPRWADLQGGLRNFTQHS